MADGSWRKLAEARKGAKIRADVVFVEGDL